MRIVPDKAASASSSLCRASDQIDITTRSEAKCEDSDCLVEFFGGIDHLICISNLAVCQDKNASFLVRALKGPILRLA